MNILARYQRAKAAFEGALYKQKEVATERDLVTVSLLSLSVSLSHITTYLSVLRLLRSEEKNKKRAGPSSLCSFSPF
jgi:hypothetical protein